MAVAVLLAILGAVITGRARGWLDLPIIDSTGTTQATASTPTVGTTPSTDGPSTTITTTADGDSAGTAMATQSNACLLLTPTIANGIFDTGVHEGRLHERRPRSACEYKPGRNRDEDVFPTVLLDQREADDRPDFLPIWLFRQCDELDDNDDRKIVEAVPSLPDGRLMACHAGSGDFPHPTQGMWIEWTVGEDTWWLGLILSHRTIAVTRESPGILPHQGAMVAAAREIDGMIQQGIGLDEEEPPPFG